jgi:hypothetical protein
MRAMLAIAIVLAGSAASAAPLTSLVERAPAGELASVHEVSTELGLDGALNASLGFAAGVPRAGERLDLAWWADVAWAAGRADVGDNRVRVGARVRLARSGRFALHGALALARRATENTGFAAQTLSSELVVAPSVSAGRFTGVAELGVEQAWIAYIAPTDTYRELVYAMAEPGWYALPGRTLRVGAAGVVRLARVELTVRGGYARTGALDFLPQLYASVGAGYRF